MTDMQVDSGMADFDKKKKEFYERMEVDFQIFEAVLQFEKMTIKKDTDDMQVDSAIVIDNSDMLTVD